MSLRILIAPDKFKGTLTARLAAEAMARGWSKIRPDDRLDLLAVSDGGDGFGEVLAESLQTNRRTTGTIDAAHRPIKAFWWWQPNSKTAIIESARVIGLAMLPNRKFHPFQLDTYGLGKVLQAAAKTGAAECVFGVGGTATNDGGFGLARSLGWRFLDNNGHEILEWWQLHGLAHIHKPNRTLGMKVTVAVDVRNRLLGSKGCSRVYGPQKGLRPEDFAHAERCLRRLHLCLKQQHGIDCASVAGAGAAGGLGFGLMAFLGADVQSGFELVAKYSSLKKRIRSSNLVITGEGAIDQQTYMGKGVGQIAKLCREYSIPCWAIAGIVVEHDRDNRAFAKLRGLTDITAVTSAKRKAAYHIEQLAALMAKELR